MSESRELAELAGQGADTVVGVPATHATTFAIRLPTTNASLFASMVASQIEKRGLAHRGDAALTPHAYHVIEQSGSETLLSIDVLSEDFPEALCLPRALGYAPAARLLKLPEDRLLVWREHQRLVLAVTHHGELCHVQALSAEPTLNLAAAQEINLTTLSLQAEGLVNDAPVLLVAGPWVDADEGDRDAFEKALLMPAEFQSDPVPAQATAGALAEGFLPAPVVRARRRRGTTRRRIVAGAIAALVYLVAGSFLWLHARAREAEISDLTRQVEATRPEVAAIQESEARWRELEPAFDLHYYPVVQLNEITRAMPGSGVVVREFRTRGREITVEGRARDVQMAFRLKEDLEKNEFFRAYTWNMPQPRVERDNTVTYRIQGQPKHEGTDN